MLDLISNWIGASGYLGVAALMLIENVFPPLPSELIMPLAGFQAARGTLSLGGVIIAGSIGSVLGAIFWFYVARALGRRRVLAFFEAHEWWLTVRPQKAEGAFQWFDRHGDMAVLIGRMIPGIRSMISLPAGIAQMGFGRFVLWSTIGSIVWVAGLTLAGYVLEAQYTRVANLIDPVATALIIGAVAIYLFRISRKLWVRASGS